VLGKKCKFGFDMNILAVKKTSTNNENYSEVDQLFTLDELKKACNVADMVIDTLASTRKLRRFSTRRFSNQNRNMRFS